MADPTTMEASERENNEWVRMRFDKFLGEITNAVQNVPNQCHRDAVDEGVARVKWLIGKAVAAGWNVAPPKDEAGE